MKMTKNIRNWFAALLFVTTIGGSFMAVAAPQPAMAACNDRLLTFPAWYRGLQDADCNIQAPAAGQQGVNNFVWKIVLNIIEMVLQAIGYIAVYFIIFGGYKYMISAGSPDGMVKARKTIVNAVIGLVISIFSVGIVNIVAGALK